MIKRIIFDIDNTLIDFPKDYDIGYKKVIKKYNYNFSSKDLYEAIGKYETCDKYKKYNIDNMVELLKEELDINITKEFFEEFFIMYNDLITEVPKEIKDTLKYLSKKYELVTLSNWFTENQVNRLKKADILKYFKEVYGTDQIIMKPNKESFLSVIGNNKVEECLMIGDNLNVDIKIPYEIGINVLYLNKNNIKTNYPTIKKIEDLKNIL